MDVMLWIVCGLVIGLMSRRIALTRDTVERWAIVAVAMLGAIFLGASARALLPATSGRVLWALAAIAGAAIFSVAFLRLFTSRSSN